MNEELDYQVLEKLLDRAKTKVFLGKRAAFYGSLACQVNFQWTTDIETAQTNGIHFWWNPHFFLSLSEDARQFVLLHELMHVGYLHIIRRGERNPLIWNYAIDIFVNNILLREGYHCDSFPLWKDFKYGPEAVEEDIYDDLIGGPHVDLGGLFGSSDEGDQISFPDGKEPDPNEVISTVVQAHTTAKSQGAGDTPGGIEEILKRFLSPKLPWNVLLFEFFNEMDQKDYTWRKPSRRHQDVYLPSLEESDGGLDHLIYYLDTSASISQGEVVRFNSEVKYIKDHFNPRKLTLVQFDTIIQHERTFDEQEPFEEILLVGGGGTSLVEVRNHIIKHEPTAAIIFSDMCVGQMEALPFPVPIIWVCLNNPGVTVPFGKLIHLRD